MYLSILSFIAISLTVVRSIPNDECAFGAFFNGAAFCFAIGGGGGTLYNISDPALDIDNIATICENVKWAIANGESCTYNDLIWDPNDQNAECPKCPCTNGQSTSYSTFENFYDQRCVECSCNTFTGNMFINCYNIQNKNKHTKTKFQGMEVNMDGIAINMAMFPYFLELIPLQHLGIISIVILTQVLQEHVHLLVMELSI